MTSKWSKIAHLLREIVREEIANLKTGVPSSPSSPLEPLLPLLPSSPPIPVSEGSEVIQLTLDGHGEVTGNVTGNVTYDYREELKDMPEYLADVRLAARWNDLRKRWAVACPAVNILPEVRRAWAKEQCGAVGKKTDHAKYLTNWLCKEQQLAASREARAGRETKQERKGDDYSWMDMPKEQAGA